MEIELFPQGVISQKNYSLSEIFLPGLLRKQDFASKSPPGHFKFDLFKNFDNSKDFNTVLT